jgi:UDP-N-acetylglucosamine 1-carboxyvinyltransferase
VAKFNISGGKALSGTVEIFGAKNAALPLMAAGLLTSEKIRLDNFPQILDVEVMTELLKDLGVKVEKIGLHSLEIEAKEVGKKVINNDLAKKLRASILLVGPMLARKNEVKIPYPGGDIIGRRSVETHLEGFRAMGAKVVKEDDHFKISAAKLKPAQIYLDEISVTATENIIMAASLTSGETIIRFAASEPHVVDLCELLNKMGAHIIGQGTPTIKIRGVDKLGSAVHAIVPDQIDAVTFACAAIVTKGNVTIRGTNFEILFPILHKFDQMNVNYTLKEDELVIRPSSLIATRIQTSPWPGFPTDCQPLFTVLATQAKGTSLIHDWMYERRLLYIDELIKMGANITLCDPHRILVSGPTKLKGTKLLGPDIRAGMAMVVAALAAEGETEIDNVELIDRGYEKIEERLRDLGANIKRVKD